MKTTKGTPSDLIAEMLASIFQYPKMWGGPDAVYGNLKTILYLGYAIKHGEFWNSDLETINRIVQKHWRGPVLPREWEDAPDFLDKMKLAVEEVKKAGLV